MLLGYMVGSRAARRNQQQTSEQTTVIYTQAPASSVYSAAPAGVSPYQTYQPPVAPVTQQPRQMVPQPQSPYQSYQQAPHNVGQMQQPIPGAQQYSQVPPHVAQPQSYQSQPYYSQAPIQAPIQQGYDQTSRQMQSHPPSSSPYYSNSQQMLNSCTVPPQQSNNGSYANQNPHASRGHPISQYTASTAPSVPQYTTSVPQHSNTPQQPNNASANTSGYQPAYLRNLNATTVPHATVPHATVPHATVTHATVPHATVPQATPSVFVSEKAIPPPFQPTQPMNCDALYPMRHQ